MQREQLGFSQERLAELALLHPTYISMLERGLRNPSLNVAARLAAALKMTLPNLISFALTVRITPRRPRVP